MTLTDCQLLSIVAQLGTFAAAAERLHITPSAVSHAVSGVEAECGFPLFTRTKSGVTLTAYFDYLNFLLRAASDFFLRFTEGFS